MQHFAMRKVNVFDCQLDEHTERGTIANPRRDSWATKIGSAADRGRPLRGVEPRDDWVWPYHYHRGVEEWLLRRHRLSGSARPPRRAETLTAGDSRLASRRATSAPTRSKALAAFVMFSIGGWPEPVGGGVSRFRQDRDAPGRHRRTRFGQPRLPARGARRLLVRRGRTGRNRPSRRSSYVPPRARVPPARGATPHDRRDLSRSEIERSPTATGAESGHCSGLCSCAERLGATLCDIDPGQEARCPYHCEHGREEWLLVIDGHA